MADPVEVAREYLIRKGGYYYRPNAQGYTAEPSAAGRFTQTDAHRHSHPNGPNGPRDGLSYIHQSAIIEQEAIDSPVK